MRRSLSQREQDDKVMAIGHASISKLTGKLNAATYIKKDMIIVLCPQQMSCLYRVLAYMEKAAVHLFPYLVPVEMLVNYHNWGRIIQIVGPT